MEVVLNKRYGGFSVSKKVFEKLNKPWNNYGFLCNEDFGIESINRFAYRADPTLINTIKEVCIEEASGHTAALVIVDIPDDIEWYITEYGGIETLRENHRSW